MWLDEGEGSTPCQKKTYHQNIAGCASRLTGLNIKHLWRCLVTLEEIVRGQMKRGKEGPTDPAPLIHNPKSGDKRL
jgi:hypothetical protein